MSFCGAPAGLIFPSTLTSCGNRRTDPIALFPVPVDSGPVLSSPAAAVCSGGQASPDKSRESPRWRYKRQREILRSSYRPPLHGCPVHGSLVQRRVRFRGAGKRFHRIAFLKLPLPLFQTKARPADEEGKQQKR